MSLRLATCGLVHNGRGRQGAARASSTQIRLLNRVRRVGMNTISFMSANFVARQVGYHMTEGGGQGERATNDYFRPLETFGQRFEELLTAVRAMGLDTIDIWTAHLNWAWATDRHIAIARDLLERHALAVASLAGGFGATADDFDAACRLAAALHTKVLGGSALFYDAQRDA